MNAQNGAQGPYPPDHPRLESMTSFMARMPIEAIRAGDAHIQLQAAAFGAITGLSGVGDLLREAWAAIRPEPTCDCPLDPHHRWNCHLTPIWAQTIRDLGMNPWTIVTWPMPIAGLHGWVRTGVLRDGGPVYTRPVTS